MGANDDLSGCFLSAAVVKFLAANDIRFENTEVVAAMVGGEEAGLRGTKAYMKAHAQEFKDEKMLKRYSLPLILSVNTNLWLFTIKT